jgi:hypothetical protein
MKVIVEPGVIETDIRLPTEKYRVIDKGTRVGSVRTYRPVFVAGAARDSSSVLAEPSRATRIVVITGVTQIAS